jgi:hypothetical protein
VEHFSDEKKLNTLKFFIVTLAEGLCCVCFFKITSYVYWMGGMLSMKNCIIVEAMKIPLHHELH